MKVSFYVRCLVVGQVLLGGSCLYDGADRCADGQEANASDLCVCKVGYAPVYREVTILAATPGQTLPVEYCQSCTATDHKGIDATKGVCGCLEGFVKTTVTGGRHGDFSCAPSNLGQTCASDADCAAGDNKTCHLPGGYCTTTGCTTNANCNLGLDYGCALPATGSTDPSFCRRPPKNQGNSCSQAQGDPMCSMEAPICAGPLGCSQIGCMTDADCSPSRKCCSTSGVTLCLGACP